MDSSRTPSIANNIHEDVCKHGFFIKSPPLHLFSNQISWKKRYFILSKSSKNGYVLKYLKGRHMKGCIEINENSEIEIGIGDTEKMTVVKKMFKCQPTEVMTIRTESRDFYLIGQDSKIVMEWATFLFATCAEKRKLEPRSRSKSSPACLDEQSAAAVLQEDLRPDNEYEEIEASACKKRPVSDPNPQKTSTESRIYESPRKILPRLRHLANTPVDEEPEEESTKEDYYASPRSVLAQLHMASLSSLEEDFAELKTPAEPDSSDDEKLKSNGGYMYMKDLVPGVAEKNIQSSCTNHELLTAYQGKENSVIPQEAENDSVRPTPLPRNFKSEKTPKLSFLSVVQLSIVLGKITDDTQLEEVDILLPRGDLIGCLSFTKASGYICVSQWKDPDGLGCVFHRGDSIAAVNDLHIKHVDEIFLFATRSTRKEVKLTVRRLPDSEILHAQGCMCP